MVIITGGLYTRKTVSVYSEAGWLSDLTSLNQGRYWHACGHYVNGEKEVNHIVSYTFNGYIMTDFFGHWWI